MRAIVLILALPLGGCLTTSVPPPVPPVVEVQGPQFAATAFEAGPRPAAPAAGDPTRQGSAGAHYEDRLRTWGGRCVMKLKSVGRALDAAGLVVRGR